MERGKYSLRLCNEHGAYRGEKCESCGELGKFLLNEWEIEVISRTMSGILRHFPEKFSVEMDEHGWVSIYDMVYVLKKKDRKLGWLRRHHLEALVITDQKGRYQVDINNKTIRSTYGHTIDVDLSDLPTDNIPEKLYYPTSEEEKDIILEIGLKPSDRKWIHLSRTYEDAYIAGRHRIENPVVLEIDRKNMNDDDIEVYRASNMVYLVKEVPLNYLKVAEIRDVELPPEEIEKIKREKERKERDEERKREESMNDI